jgi:hypothetical protein
LPLSEPKPKPPVGGTCKWAEPLNIVLTVVFVPMYSTWLGEMMYKISVTVPGRPAIVRLAEIRPFDTVSLVSA